MCFFALNGCASGYQQRHQAFVALVDEKAKMKKLTPAEANYFKTVSETRAKEQQAAAVGQALAGAAGLAIGGYTALSAANAFNAQAGYYNRSYLRCCD